MVIDRIKDIAKSEDIPVLGFGSASLLGAAPLGHRPDDLLPGARGLVCFGIPVPRGSYETPISSSEVSWRSQNLMYRRLDTISSRFASLFEENGEKAVPVYGCMPMDINQNRDVAGYINQIRIAEALGIGIIGRNALLLHPAYGSRLMLGSVITTADLPAFRSPDIEIPDCPPDCRICADACPVRAISPENKQVNVMRCLGYTARTHAMSRFKFLVLRMLQPSSAARYISLRAFDEHTFHICSKCVSLCPYGRTNSR